MYLKVVLPLLLVLFVGELKSQINRYACELFTAQIESVQKISYENGSLLANVTSIFSEEGHTNLTKVEIDAHKCVKNDLAGFRFYCLTNNKMVLFFKRYRDQEIDAINLFVQYGDRVFKAIQLCDYRETGRGILEQYSSSYNVQFLWISV